MRDGGVAEDARSPIDAGVPPDTGAADAASRDVGSLDSTVLDATPRDADMPDGSTLARPDASAPDAATEPCGLQTGDASVRPATCGRSMYISLATTTIGRQPLWDPNHENVLGAPAKEAHLLERIRDHRFDRVALYNLHRILRSATATTALASLMIRMRAAGVQHIDAIGAVNRDWDRIGEHQRRVTDPDAEFDGLLTEIEFWNSGGFADYRNALDYMRQLGLTRASGAPLTISTYIGWLRDGEGSTAADKAEAIASRADRVFVHCYVRDASTGYRYCRSRIRLLDATGHDVEVHPIFSAEGMMYSAGSEHFMGEWLANTAHPLNNAENLWLHGAAADATLTRDLVHGFVYYEYIFVDSYLP